MGSPTIPKPDGLPKGIVVYNSTDAQGADRIDFIGGTDALKDLKENIHLVKDNGKMKIAGGTTFITKIENDYYAFYQGGEGQTWQYQRLSEREANNLEIISRDGNSAEKVIIDESVNLPNLKIKTKGGADKVVIEGQYDADGNLIAAATVGDVKTGNGDDKVQNYGHITGDVRTGGFLGSFGGDDKVNNVGGVIDGTVKTNGGTDVVTNDDFGRSQATIGGDVRLGSGKADKYGSNGGTLIGDLVKADGKDTKIELTNGATIQGDIRKVLGLGSGAAIAAIAAAAIGATIATAGTAAPALGPMLGQLVGGALGLSVTGAAAGVLGAATILGVGAVGAAAVSDGSKNKAINTFVDSSSYFNGADAALNAVTNPSRTSVPYSIPGGGGISVPYGTPSPGQLPGAWPYSGMGMGGNFGFPSSMGNPFGWGSMMGGGFPNFASLMSGMMMGGQGFPSMGMPASWAMSNQSLNMNAAMQYGAMGGRVILS